MTRGCQATSWLSSAGRETEGKFRAERNEELEGAGPLQLFRLTTAQMERNSVDVPLDDTVTGRLDNALTAYGATVAPKDGQCDDQTDEAR